MSGPLPTSSASPLSMSGLDGEPTGVADDEEIVVSFDSLLHAELVRGRLEASGIAARLEDAHTVGKAVCRPIQAGLPLAASHRATARRHWPINSGPW